MHVITWIALFILGATLTYCIIVWCGTYAVAKRLRAKGWQVYLDTRWDGVELKGFAPEGRMVHIKSTWWKR